jgi:hypothetical protein
LPRAGFRHAASTDITARLSKSGWFAASVATGIDSSINQDIIMSLSIPNFLIIGDLRAATSSLHNYLSQHPDVFMSRPKELRFFAFDPENDYQNRSQATVARTWDEYLRYFSGCGDAAAVGEASPNYLRTPGAAARIKASLPHVKLIVSLRNPADRLFSLYQLARRRGSSNIPFDQQAFQGSAYWIKGNYCWLDLRAYFDLFDREQIKVLLFEDIVCDPVYVTRSLYRFLGVNEDFTPKIDRQNSGGVPSSRFTHSVLLSGRRTLKRYIEPSDSLKKLWSAVSERSLTRVSLDGKLRRQILAVCRDDILRTQELIERDLIGWLQ